MMIEGVCVKQLKPIADERGRLMEILRADDEIFRKFGQAYITTAYPGVTKAWHTHTLQTDCFTAVSGMMKLVLYDMRKDSTTKGDVNEFFMGDHNPILVTIPPGVAHGFKCIGQREAVVVNIPTEPYNPDKPDELRIDAHENDIPYDWSRVDG